MTTAPTNPSHPESPPLAELVSRLSEDLKLLTRQEFELAKRELSGSFDQAERRVTQLALGAGALGAGLLVLLAAAVLALATVMPAWSAAVLVGGGVSVLGCAFLLIGKSNLSDVSFKPTRALQGFEKDVSAIKKAAQ